MSVSSFGSDRKIIKMGCRLLFHIILFSQMVSTIGYNIDLRATSRQYDGIGGLSGGGSTSKLLVNYQKQYRDEILDYLFKPNFGASLQILKVEIGGDGQSTDGTESSHMHNKGEENYHSGYEWWLMKEAKLRNPDIKLYGLPWVFPGWLKGENGSVYEEPVQLADYIVKWLSGAKTVHKLDIDYIGIWNERPYNIRYIKQLRKSLNIAGFNKIKIVASDGDWSIAEDMLKDPNLNNTVDIIGVHYPGTVSSSMAQKTSKTLWSSEDYSTYNDNIGAGCWARILNRNFVNGNMTSTISWNLIAAYYNDLPFGRCGLMTAVEPWGGHYRVESPIWITAHTTQFSKIGWHYLKHGSGSGKLDNGGTYVSLVSPGGKDFTMVLETMSRDHSVCIRPALPDYNVTAQNATFVLKNSMHKTFQVWKSKLGFNGEATTLMSLEKPLEISGNHFTIYLEVDTVYTITTVKSGQKGRFKKPPSSKPFPLPYHDDFNNYEEFAEAFNFSPQIGVFEVRKSNNDSHGLVNTQVVMEHTQYWCAELAQPFTLGGNYNWSDIQVTLDAFIPSQQGAQGIIVGLRVDEGGCDVVNSEGVFLALDFEKQTFMLTTDFRRKNIVHKGSVQVTYDTWLKVDLRASGDNVTAFLNNYNLFNTKLHTPEPSGFVGYGSIGFGHSSFDNLHIDLPRY